MKTIFLLPILFALPATAAVNMKDASFTQSWQDLHGLNRTYDSRSLHRGIFGFGWCTEYEKKLDLRGSFPLLEDCEGGSRELPHLRPEKKTYRWSSGEKVFIFNLRGALTGIESTGLSRQLTYDGAGHLRKIDFGDFILHLNYNASGFVKDVRASDGEKSRYLYQADNLVRVTNTWKSIYRFRYDELHNLTRVDYPDRSLEQITYDTDRDWVRAFRSRDKCLETYSFIQQPDRLRSEMRRQCPGRTATLARFEFWYRMNLWGENALNRVCITQGPHVTEVSYDPISGTARRVERRLAAVASRQGESL